MIWEYHLVLFNHAYHEYDLFCIYTIAICKCFYRGNINLILRIMSCQKQVLYFMLSCYYYIHCSFCITLCIYLYIIDLLNVPELIQTHLLYIMMYTKTCVKGLLTKTQVKVFLWLEYSSLKNIASTNHNVVPQDILYFSENESFYFTNIITEIQ